MEILQFFVLTQIKFLQGKKSSNLQTYKIRIGTYIHFVHIDHLQLQVLQINEMFHAFQRSNGGSIFRQINPCHSPHLFIVQKFVPIGVEIKPDIIP